MPDQPTSSPSSTKTSSTYTAGEIIKMFQELELRVCDDNDAIREKVAAQRGRYLSDKRKADPGTRHLADVWFKNVEALQHRRPELLRVVYEHFARLADTALEAAITQGLKTVDPSLVETLRRLAHEDCRTEAKLAEQFVDDYMQHHDPPLILGQPPRSPAPVESFSAVSGLGKISLYWSTPKEKWDEVEVVRVVDSAPPGKKETKKEVTVYRGHGEVSFVDGDVVPGTWYTYRAHTILQKFKGTDLVAKAVCLGEVGEARAAWREGCIGLTWELPAKGVSVLIFRSSDSTPLIQMGPGGPEPADKSTQQVYHSGDTSWEDTNVVEGVTYYYRIVADFGPNLFTEGVVVQARIPPRPPAALALTATYRREAEEDVVVLEWQPAPGDMPVEYVIVRREGEAPAGEVEEDAVLGKTAQTRYLDKQVVAGRRYTYAVFCCLGDLYSRTGTSAPPVDILTEVAGLTAQIGDGTIELEWRTPLNVSDVIIRRSLNPPRDHAEGTLVKLTGAGHAKDSGLRNGQRYHYLVCCVYRPGGTTEVFSPGVCIAAVPEQLPDPVVDLAGRAQGLEVVCTWTPPAHGQVVVVRSAKPHEWPFGYRLAADEVNGLGVRIVTVESGRAVDIQPDSREPFYSAFTLAGPYAVAGGTQVACVDATDLKLSATQHSVILRWTWPLGCTAVKVARRTGAWPTGPDDPLAGCVLYTRVEYKAAGEKFVGRIEESSGKFCYTVYAQAAGAPDHFAPGVELGCRAEIQWERQMTLRYRLSSPKDSHKGANILLTWSVEEPFPNFAGFALIADQAAIPTSPAGGIEIYRWTPGTEPIEGTHKAWVSLAPIQQRRWARFFCRAMVLDPAQRHVTLIIHPNICLSISDAGEIESGRPAGEAPRYPSGAPRAVVCPQCFEKFPPENMLFDSYGGGEAMPARYTWLDRLLHRPPRPPKDKQGRLLTRKLCPNHHPLPFTAGSQASLVIGLIGAKFSGKSHYIASLIERLEGQTGSDLQAALLPVTDETQERYRNDFYNPMFGKGLELAITIGTPPPLIYDLTIDGRLFGEKRNRAVTLALYDTAGENLQDAATARQMVQYLQVASAVMFLVDPLQVPRVRDALPASVQPPMLDQEAAPNQIIANVIQLLENGKIVEANAPLSIPVAVVLTKCDVLRDADLIDTDRLWSTDKRHIGYFDAEAHEDMVGMMGGYFQLWDPAAYSNIKRRFSRHAFFGVSATGCASDQVTRRYKFISPWRVEDPLLWLLAELGVIPMR